MSDTQRRNRPIGLGRSVEEELAALNTSIDKHLNALNVEGVWLFLASLSCWSVPEGLPRLLALIASLILFGQQYKSHGHDQRIIPKQFEASALRIAALPLTEDEKIEGRGQIERLRDARMSGLKPIYRTPSFIIGWSTWGATLAHTLLHVK